MSPKKLLLTRILPIVLLIVIGYGWWWTRPTQVINRQADSLIHFLEYRRINLDNENTYTNQIEDLFANPLSLKLEDTDESEVQFSSGDYTHEEILEKLKELHKFTSAITVTQKKRNHVINGTEAKINLELEIKASAGQSFSKNRNLQDRTHPARGNRLENH